MVFSLKSWYNLLVLDEEGEMRKPAKLRLLTTEKRAEIQRLAASCTQPLRLVQRARLIALMMDHPELYACEAAKQVGFRSPTMGVFWARRFNEDGLAGLQDKKRSGRKPMPSHLARKTFSAPLEGFPLAAESPLVY